MRFTSHHVSHWHIGQSLKQLLPLAVMMFSLTAMITPNVFSQVFHVVVPSGDTFENASQTAVQPPLQSPTPPVNQPVLHLINGDFCAGQLLDTDQPDIVRWNAPFATQLFDFRATPSPRFIFSLPKNRPQNNRRKNLLLPRTTIPSNLSAATSSPVPYQT